MMKRGGRGATARGARGSIGAAGKGFEYQHDVVSAFEEIDWDFDAPNTIGDLDRYVDQVPPSEETLAAEALWFQTPSASHLTSVSYSNSSNDGGSKKDGTGATPPQAAQQPSYQDTALVDGDPNCERADDGAGVGRAVDGDGETKHAHQKQQQRNQRGTSGDNKENVKRTTTRGVTKQEREGGRGVQAKRGFGDSSGAEKGGQGEDGGRQSKRRRPAGGGVLAPTSSSAARAVGAACSTVTPAAPAGKDVMKKRLEEFRQQKQNAAAATTVAARARGGGTNAVSKIKPPAATEASSSRTRRSAFAAGTATTGGSATVAGSAASAGPSKRKAAAGPVTSRKLHDKSAAVSGVTKDPTPITNKHLDDILKGAVSSNVLGAADVNPEHSGAVSSAAQFPPRESAGTIPSTSIVKSENRREDPTLLKRTRGSSKSTVPTTKSAVTATKLVSSGGAEATTRPAETTTSSGVATKRVLATKTVSTVKRTKGGAAGPTGSSAAGGRGVGGAAQRGRRQGNGRVGVRGGQSGGLNSPRRATVGSGRPDARRPAAAVAAAVAELGLDSEFKARLEAHNKVVNKGKSTFEPAMSVRDYRKWEQKTGRKYRDLSVDERREANAEIVAMLARAPKD